MARNHTKTVMWDRLPEQGEAWLAASTMERSYNLCSTVL